MGQEARIAAHYVSEAIAATEFEHSEWTNAQAIQITREWSGNAAPASRHAEARIIWTEDSLIVRFVCHQNEPLTVNRDPQLNKKTIRLWDKDVCEIFLAPDATAPQRYFEFEAAPTGEWVDLAIDFSSSERETNFEYRSGMTVAAKIAERQIIIAMAIPWSESIPKPMRGAVWRVNLFRCVGAGNERYLAWLPTHTPEPNFHVPEVFGWLDFA